MSKREINEERRETPCIWRAKRSILREPSSLTKLSEARSEKNERRSGNGAPACNSICELCIRRRRCEDSPRYPRWARRLNKLYTYNLTQIPGSKWGLTRGRKGETEGRGTVGGDGEKEKRSGGFLRSRQTKYNSTSYKEGSRQDEGSLSFSSSFSSSSHSFRRSLSLPPLSSISKKAGGRENEPSWSMNGLRRAVFIHSLLGGLETHKKCISSPRPSP